MVRNRADPPLKAAIVVVLLVIVALVLVDRIDVETRLHQAEAEVSELTTQNRGPQGPDGDPGRAPTEEEIAAAIDEYCSAHNSCIGPAGATGPAGSTGPTGSAGASVGSVQCNGTSISFYSTTGTYLGSVKAVCIP